MEYSQAAPSTLKDVRFFAATTSVTIRGELGLIEGLIAAKSDKLAELLDSTLPTAANFLKITADSARTLSSINERLFQKNMRVLRDLLQTWKAPRDPRVASPRNVLTAFDFDMAMVDFEQSEVQAFLDTTSVSVARITNINRLMTLQKDFLPGLSLVSTLNSWAEKAGFKRVDFGDKGWRVALGRAIVFRFNNKTEGEYLAYMKAHPVAKQPRAALYDGMQAPLRYTADVTGSFTVLGSWRTEGGAKRHLAKLRSDNPGLQASVYPPYGSDRYWTVMGATFSANDTAAELAKVARNKGVAHDAYVIKRKAVDAKGNKQAPVAGAAELGASSRLLDPLPTTHDALHNHFLSVLKTSSLDEARTAYADWRIRFPDLQVGLYKVGMPEEYLIALAAFVSETEVELARQMARKVGVATEDINTWTLQGGSVERLNEKGTVATDGWEKVKECYQSGSITAAALHQCSGQWLTPTILTRCIIQNDCDGLGDKLLPTMDRVRAFYASQGLNFDDGLLELKILTEAVPLSTNGNAFVNGMINCKNTSGGNKDAYQKCLSTEVLPDAQVNLKSLECLQASNSNEQALQCVSQAGALPSMAGKIECFSEDGMGPTETARCLMSDSDKQALEKAKKCLSGASSERAALTKCFGALLPTEARQAADCVAGNADSPRNVISCFTGDNPTARKAAQAFDCATQKDISSQQAASCVAELVGGDAAMVAACTSSAANAGSALSCMLENKPELQAAREAYECASKATSAASIVAYCSGDSIDPKAKALAACIANGGADFSNAAASCAASAMLPPELASVVGCAAQSTGAVDTALCIGAPSMNAEMRMALECASSTGGEPISFASCTAGRLTVAELTKCLSGRVGQDCFGKGNSIIVAFDTVASDLSKCTSGGACLGENNDITKAARGAEKFIADVGEKAGDAWNGAFGPGSAWCRGDLTGWTCPGKSSDWCRGDLTGWTC
ncbi:hypothetical protein [Aeromonas hydrophila]|nr:hypothetical protein [Aeromonas hydrophila]MBM0437695.1 hypothetical protein [Aeromonas hydrophila subsp. ranae]MBW3829122.1 hypothetical protein [Aeromonas hydrophila]